MGSCACQLTSRNPPACACPHAASNLLLRIFVQNHRATFGKGAGGQSTRSDLAMLARQSLRKVHLNAVAPVAMTLETTVDSQFSQAQAWLQNRHVLLALGDIFRDRHMNQLSSHNIFALQYICWLGTSLEN